VTWLLTCPPENSASGRSNVGGRINNSKDSHYERRTTGGQVTDYAGDARAQAIAAAAADLNAKREAWLNPPDLIIRLPEVVPGYPDRLLPRDDKAAAILKSRTLTNLYNARPTWLTHLHATLDQAVADAYGWGDDWRAGMDDDTILSRLFALNQDRAAQQQVRANQRG
jgi:hypothetical protein